MTDADRDRCQAEAEAMLERWAREETRPPYRAQYDYDVLIVRHLLAALDTATTKDDPCT